MAPEPFSTGPERPRSGELLDPTSIHWGTAQLGARPPTRTATPGATGEDGVPRQDASGSGGAAIEELVHTAVVSRPLDDVVHLVTLLEQSPDGISVAESALRVAAVARSVDDVTRLVELLGHPAHHADLRDEAIRIAAEQRPLSDVSRLVLLLRRPPHAPDAGSRAVRAAAGRPVEDLVQLIEHLGEDRDAADAGDPKKAAKAASVRRPSTDGPRPAPPAVAPLGLNVNGVTLLVWLRRVAGVLVLLCGVAHFPFDRSDAPAHGLAAGIAVVAVCALAGLALCFSGSPVVAALCVLPPAALAVGHLLATGVGSTTLSYVLQADGVAAPLPQVAAVTAAVACLAVLALAVARRQVAVGRPVDSASVGGS
ncbi:hypothetical protein OK074_1202 [Actinobacteria bacterium OK074]|nr:hypothetical protein OK074_1202 [Actinobacteria bacterium OK074]